MQVATRRILSRVAVQGKPHVRVSPGAGESGTGGRAAPIGAGDTITCVPEAP